jgi:hypothetical protein
MDHLGEHKYQQHGLLSGLLPLESNGLGRKAPILALCRHHREEDQEYVLNDPPTCL